MYQSQLLIKDINPDVFIIKYIVNLLCLLFKVYHLKIHHFIMKRKYILFN